MSADNSHDHQLSHHHHLDHVVDHSSHLHHDHPLQHHDHQLSHDLSTHHLHHQTQEMQDHQQQQDDQQHHHDDHQQLQDINDAQQQIAAFPNLESMLPGGLTQEQAMAFQQFQAMHGVLPVLNGQFPRPTVKRRKPVKWELWEEKNLIEGVRRFGRGNWAQIRAAFEFNPCRTNVDLHDKWRVLTGERKRNRQRPDSNSQSGNVITAEIPADGSSQKVQLVPVAGTNGLYTLAASQWPAHLLEGQAVQFPAELLQQLQQGDLLNHGGELSDMQHHQHNADGDQQLQHLNPLEQHHHQHMEKENISPVPAKKKARKQKKEDEDIAHELLKLSSPKQHHSDTITLEQGQAGISDQAESSNELPQADDTHEEEYSTDDRTTRSRKRRAKK